MTSLTGSTGIQRKAGSSSLGNTAGGFQDKIPSGYKKGQLQQFTPEQMQLFQSLFSNVGPNSFLSKLAGGDESAFEQSEQPFWKQFQEAQGQLGSRFSQFAPGAMSAQGGSGFKNAGGQLGSDFAMQLGARRQDLQRQALMDLMGLSNTLLNQKPYENFLTKKSQNPWSEIIGKLGGAIPGLVTSAFTGNPGGALKGAFSIFGGGENSGYNF